MTRYVCQFSDEEILMAALEVSLDDNGNPSHFNLNDIRRRLLAGTSRRKICSQKDSGLTGSKVQAVLSRHPDIFRPNYSTGSVKVRIINYIRITDSSQ